MRLLSGAPVEGALSQAGESPEEDDQGGGGSYLVAHEPQLMAFSIWSQGAEVEALRAEGTHLWGCLTGRDQTLAERPLNAEPGPRGTSSRRFEFKTMTSSVVTGAVQQLETWDLGSGGPGRSLRSASSCVSDLGLVTLLLLLKFSHQ